MKIRSLALALLFAVLFVLPLVLRAATARREELPAHEEPPQDPLPVERLCSWSEPPAPYAAPADESGDAVTSNAAAESGAVDENPPVSAQAVPEEMTSENETYDEVASGAAASESAAEEPAPAPEPQYLAPRETPPTPLSPPEEKGDRDEEPVAPSKEQSKKDKRPSSAEKTVSLRPIERAVPSEYAGFVGSVREILAGKYGSPSAYYSPSLRVYNDGGGYTVRADFPLDEIPAALEYVFPYTAQDAHYSVGVQYGVNVFYITHENLALAAESERIARNFVERAAGAVAPEMTEREAYRALHDYVRDYLSYDYTFAVRTLREGIERRTGVCIVYARLTKALCERVGISCKVTEAVLPTGYHAWNIITIGGKQYYSDVCWDESVPERYFLSPALWDDHKGA